MRILVINGNTSQDITEFLATEARAAASPGTEVVPLTATFGARVIAGRRDNAIAAHAVLALLEAHGAGAAAAIVATSLDTGLAAAREAAPLPVVGLTEATLLTACMLGGRFGLVVFDRRTVALYRELVESYGLAARLATIRVVDLTAAEVWARPEAVAPELAEQIRLAVTEHGAESVAVLGAVAVALAPRLQPDSPVPVLAPMRCAVLQAELLARLRMPKPTAGSHALPRPGSPP
jgi:allantoin racemase